MNAWTLMWNLTIFLVHLGVLIALGVLWRDVPDKVQRIAIGLLIASSMLFMWGSWMQLLGVYVHRDVAIFARDIEHIGVMVYVLRLFVADQERRCLNHYSTTSRISRQS